MSLTTTVVLYFGYLGIKSLNGKSFVFEPITYEKGESGQRESNPHGQLGRLELYH